MPKTKNKNDNIGTETVNVVKPYSPTISDAFKVKETPAITTDENAKETIKYCILSVPVASTFSPSKGNAQGLKNQNKNVCLIIMRPWNWKLWFFECRIVC